MYLYIFKNKTTGKKYLGYTESDIKTYKGSGKYWSNHCKSNGGFTLENIERLWYQWFDNKEEALMWLETFESNNPEYWLSEDWCNLVPETLEKSPFKGNMKTIFERNGNPFKGGDIQRQAHADGKHDYDFSENAKKGWKKRDKSEAARKMQEGHLRWRKENKEKYSELQRQKSKLGNEAIRNKLIKLEFEGKIYRGWSELSRVTGITKWYLKKDPRVIKL